MTCWPEEHAAATELISGVFPVPSSVLATISDTVCSLVSEDCESPSEVTTVVTGSVFKELSWACNKSFNKFMLLEVRYLGLLRRWGYVKGKRDYFSKFSNSYSSIFQDWVVLVVSRSMYESVFVLGMNWISGCHSNKADLNLFMVANSHYQLRWLNQTIMKHSTFLWQWEQLEIIIVK